MNKGFSKLFLACGLFLMSLNIGCSSADSQMLESKGGINLQAYDSKIDVQIGQMTLEEKVNMIHASSSFTSGGVLRLGIPELRMSDGPHGVRPEHGRDWALDNAGNDSATYLPTGIGLAATWNPELGYLCGEVLGKEARKRGKDVILGPGVNIIRTPLNGRNFEYMSEDPYLASRLVVGYIKGVQEQGVAASVKHFAANNQEIGRDYISVEMSERTLREIYLPAFEAAVREGEVLTVMGAYNKFRGQHATHNEYLVNEILKGEWGFKGMVLSDWGAVHNTMEALLYGTDLEMGTDLLQKTHIDYSKFLLADTVVSLVKSGKVPESVINDKVRRILRVMHHTNMFGEREAGEINTKEHQQAALKIAEESIVLLKNEDHILPLQKDKLRSIAVIGANANHKQSMGGGSSQVRSPYEITPLQGIKNLVGNSMRVSYAPGFEINRDEKANTQLIEEAVAAAKAADVVVYVGGWTHGYSDDWNGGAYDMESMDKPSLRLPFEQDQLIEALLAANPNTVMVMMGGGPVDMSQWIDHSKGILQAWYPGMEGGTALAGILFGEVNPSGKLPLSFPKELKDSPAHALGQYPGNKDTTAVHYHEGVFVGYRYHDTYEVKPLFSFGHGLSYTSFEFSDMELSKNDDKITVKLSIKNTGKTAGAEVVQLYIEDLEPAVKRPKKELKGFQKVFLQPGESTTVNLMLGKEAFQYFDEKSHQWILAPGKYAVLSGSSSSDIRLSETVAW